NRLVVEADVVQLLWPKTGLLQAVVDRMAREPVIVLRAGEALFLGGGDNLAIDHERRRRVVIEGGYPEDGCHRRCESYHEQWRGSSPRLTARGPATIQNPRRRGARAVRQANARRRVTRVKRGIGCGGDSRAVMSSAALRDPGQERSAASIAMFAGERRARRPDRHPVRRATGAVRRAVGVGPSIDAQSRTGWRRCRRWWAGVVTA